jgi:hypothetical protein
VVVAYTIKGQDRSGNGHVCDRAQNRLYGNDTMWPVGPWL